MKYPILKFSLITYPFISNCIQIMNINNSFFDIFVIQMSKPTKIIILPKSYIKLFYHYPYIIFYLPFLNYHNLISYHLKLIQNMLYHLYFQSSYYFIIKNFQEIIKNYLYYCLQSLIYYHLEKNILHEMNLYVFFLFLKINSNLYLYFNQFAYIISHISQPSILMI